MLQQLLTAMGFDAEEEEEEEDSSNYEQLVPPSLSIPLNTHTEAIRKEMQRNIGNSSPLCSNSNALSMLQARERCCGSKIKPCFIANNILPHHPTTIDSFPSQTFCGQFSKDGTTFMSACQDKKIRLYDSETWSKLKEIKAHEIGWSIIDTDYSPDQRWLAYSSWSRYVRICNIKGESEDVHEDLDFKTTYGSQSCLFSIKFSANSSEIIGCSSDRGIYVYDLEKRMRTLKIKGHREDINTVQFASSHSPHLLLSASDDCDILLWDRRAPLLSPQGTLVGHLSGITHIAPRDNQYHLISNSKDQSIKLWDLRCMAQPDEVRPIKRLQWDYRYGPRHAGSKLHDIFQGKLVHPKDSSLLTFRGHQVFRTLIRCYFSPQHSTGQRYIYTGSHDGSVYIYDIISGELVKKLSGGHGEFEVVRDVSWHPNKPQIVSSSWDGTICKWDAKRELKEKDEAE